MHSHFYVHLLPILSSILSTLSFHFFSVPSFLARLCLYSFFLSITLFQLLNVGIWEKETTALERLARYAKKVINMLKKVINLIKILEKKVGKE